MRFDGKAVLVTGAGLGIGRATALLFARKGARVAIADLSLAGGEETLKLVKEAGAEGIFIRGDVSLVSDAERMVKETVKAFGRIDILVNNAGIVLPGTVDNTTEEDFDKTFRVNVKGAFFVAKYAVQEMKKAGGGAIVNVASVAALKGVRDRAAYSASKGALVGLTKAMAIDYIRDNIRVNAVCPGTTYTPAIEEKIRKAPDPEAMRAEFISRQPMGRLGKEEEIAWAILFACCDEAAYMTGSLVSIDGGSSL
ncbi:SDR family NAD(P)-dependent oxidoreductase [Moorella sulfitireducens]|uniref:SDR family NAD(P)-dependent oxidoreductase n=1 Tax=Neomoorella sulfitireducens TaxID=2972948 RepID=UPI0021ACDDB1|nr:glucose 1-dehydrogenase [Moorella sulfitireducens]